MINVSYSDRQLIPIPILWATPDSLHMQNWSRPSRAAFHLFVQSIKSNHEGHSILAFRIFWYLWNNQVCKIVWYVMDQEGGWFDHAKVIFQLFTSSGESLVSQWHEGHALVTLIFKVQKLNLYTSQLSFSSLKSCFKRKYWIRKLEIFDECFLRPVDLEYGHFILMGPGSPKEANFPW